MKKDIVFFGIQGAGKTVQSREIMKKFSGEYEHMSPGQLGREMSQMDNMLWRYINEIQLSGKFFQSEFTNSMVDMFFWAVVYSGKSIIFDGYTRTEAQTKHALDLCKNQKRDVVWIFLDIPEDVGIERMMLRGRSDDTPDAIKRRIAFYYEETLPRIEYFGKHFPLHNVDGNRTVEEVFGEISNIIS